MSGQGREHRSEERARSGAARGSEQRNSVSLRYAYNTNGLTSHRLDDALSFLADTGYAGVALTLDVHHLDPFADDARAHAERVRRRCDDLGLGVMVGTMVGTSLATAPAFLLGQICDLVDLDGPTFLSNDRDPGARYQDGELWVSPEVWGSAGALVG